ncbi:MAG: transmembrane 9 family protein [Sediminibacterium sp.]|nr:transmembrane 9 family protein [Sediminibacterium sp.]
MEQQILDHINHPAELENLYRNNKVRFKTAFLQLYPTLSNNPVAETWKQRLNYSAATSFVMGSRKEMVWVLLLVLLSGCIAHLPTWLSLNPELFFPKHIGLIVFPALGIYFAFKKNIPVKQLLLPALFVIITAIFINWIPANPDSQTSLLSSLHLPFLLWIVTGFIFAGARLHNTTASIEYLQHNGNWLVLTALMVITAFLFTALSVALFTIIGIDLATIYQNYVLIWALAALPVISTYIVYNNPQLVNRISPLIASLLTPVVVITLFIFLVSLTFSVKRMYTDRNFLLTFNIMLVAVLAIIFFSLTSAQRHYRSVLHYLQTALALLAFIANAIALSAIIFRLAGFGFTPNRIAMLGANLLIFLHLASITYQLIQSLRNNNSIHSVEASITRWIPVYAIWAAIVVFLFPLLFHFT